MYLVESIYFSTNYQQMIPLVSTTMLALNHSAQFIGLSGYQYEAFDAILIQHVGQILNFTRESVKEWLLGGTLRHSTGNKSFRLTPADRLWNFQQNY